MSSFSHLIRFESEDGNSYFADLGPDAKELPSSGAKIDAFTTLDALTTKSESERTIIRRLLAPLPRDGIPIYCVGLNYRSHAKEADLQIPAYPPLWTKPTTSLAHPGEDIPVNDFCAKSLLDYEGELVFVTSKDCKNISLAEAKDYILGYTIGNDLSCRMFQLPKNSAGQFFFAKAFDKFAPIGPSLISPELFDSKSFKVVTRVNGEVRQTAEFNKDLIFSPEKILSHMSQGTTIPAGTAVMTGTPAGVGAFRKPKTFLQNGDVVEVEMEKVGVLRNKINFE
ncbi:Fumarylacetoacetate hydrolase domain-containing-like protein [Cladobotryum mycophilum]|uniref:Fumarylacetoacetate hydrolase domain-containing-like protein n=1 Tax=Cladobotryum mycophilum TaxID=491253 RepID=A0ABR0S8T2_9HYPO